MTPDDLKAWRLALGLTQDEAAEALGYGKRQYTNLEWGRSEIRPVVALACAAIHHRLPPWTPKK